MAHGGHQLLDGEARFDLKRQLADTLQGRIYSATDRNTTDYCVVKETWKQLVRMKRSRDGHRVPEDFENEKAIMSYLSNDPAPHPGFVRILDEWEDEHCYFYAMEGCRGGELFQYIKDQHTKGSLQSWVTSQSRLPQKPMKENNEWTLMVKTMFRQLVDCVAWMHNRGVCHLDLSLENSMIHDRRKKHVKIIDFGLGKYFGNDNLQAINKQYNKDKADPINQGKNIKPKYGGVDPRKLKFTNNQRVGKTGYMAPEVYDRKQYDARSADIWSLGVMLFMMCIGAPPYEYPTEQNAAFRFIIGGKLADVLKHWKRLRLVTEQQLDLMVRIFKPEEKRITMDEILQHPFVELTQKPLFVPISQNIDYLMTDTNNSELYDEKTNNNDDNDNDGNNGGSGSGNGNGSGNGSGNSGNGDNGSGNNGGNNGGNNNNNNNNNNGNNGNNGNNNSNNNNNNGNPNNNSNYTSTIDYDNNIVNNFKNSNQNSNDRNNNDNRNNYSSDKDSGGGGGGVSSNGFNSSNDDDDTDMTGNSSNQTQNQQNRQHLDDNFESEIAQNFQKDLKNRDNAGIDELKRVLNEVERTRDEYLNAANKDVVMTENDNRNEINGSGIAGDTNTLTKAMSIEGEDKHNDKHDVIIKELNTIHNYVSNKIVCGI